MSENNLDLLFDLQDDPFTNGYLQGFLFTEEEALNEEYAAEFGDDDDADGWGLSSIWGPSLRSIESDCEEFVQACEEAGIDLEERGYEMSGIDFWLIRNKLHDRVVSNDPAERLFVSLAKEFGECSVYIGDNGEIVIASNGRKR